MFIEVKFFWEGKMCFCYVYYERMYLYFLVYVILNIIYFISCFVVYGN